MWLHRAITEEGGRHAGASDGDVARATHALCGKLDAVTAAMAATNGGALAARHPSAAAVALESSAVALEATGTLRLCCLAQPKNTIALRPRAYTEKRTRHTNRETGQSDTNSVVTRTRHAKPHLLAACAKSCIAGVTRSLNRCITTAGGNHSPGKGRSEQEHKRSYQGH